MSIMTTRQGKSPQQIVRLLGQTDQLLSKGEVLASVCRTLGISGSRFHRLRARYGDMNVDDAKCLRVLGAENATLIRLQGDAEVEKAALTEIAKENGEPAC